MLRPIKNFFSYLQKNASSSTFFGINANMSENTSIVADAILQPPNDSKKRNNSKEILLTSSQNSHDQNENEVIVINDENKHPTVELCIDLCETNNELDKNVDSSEFRVNEVLVDEDSEQNISLIDPTSDPLAIDDFQTDIAINNSTILTSTSRSDLDTSGEVIFICDMEGDEEKELEDCGNLIEKNPLENDNDKTDQQTVASLTGVNTSLEEFSEEQEIRSDGSDSGLGSESSTLQITVTSIDSNVNIDSPIIKQSSTRSNLKRRANDEPDLSQKRQRRSIHFDSVKVYYFPRIQGFACVPSQGGCTLGMGARHIHSRNFTLAEHAAEQRRVHKQQMQEINPRGSSSEETDSEEELSEGSGSDLDADANGFLQPVPARQRRALLKAAGIRKIDTTEKDECRAIRSSREFCGCSCRGYCDPDTCSCSQAGIKCQVDRPSFPCGCTRDGCANVVGRVEFNPSRVRTHFIHTIMRLDLENKQKRPDELDTASTTTMLNYGNNVTNGSNLSGGASINGSSICNYNLANTTNMHAQNYAHLHNQSYMNSGHVSIYPTNMMQSGEIPDNCSVSHLPMQQQLNNHNNVMNIGGVNQQMDMHYPFREVNSNSGSNNSGNLMIDFSSTSNQVYHDCYGGQSYMNHSYHNSNSTQNNYHTPAASYSSYQQHYISYTTSANCNDSSEIHDLTSTDDESNSYINLHPPPTNSPRLDAIHEFLQNNRNSIPTTTLGSSITEPMPIKPVNVTPSISCTLAPSAQTSTSVTEGTKITSAHSPIITPINLPVVDLTEEISTGGNILGNKVTLDDSSSDDSRMIFFDNFNKAGVENNDCGKDSTESYSNITANTTELIRKSMKNNNRIDIIKIPKDSDKSLPAVINTPIKGTNNVSISIIPLDTLSSPDCEIISVVNGSSSHDQNIQASPKSIVLTSSNETIEIDNESEDSHNTTPNGSVTTNNSNQDKNTALTDDKICSDDSIIVQNSGQQTMRMDKQISYYAASSDPTSICSKNAFGKTSVQTDENLTEIIKESIVETVSA